MGFERYVDYALDVPMYFVYRDGRYHQRRRRKLPRLSRRQAAAACRASGRRCKDWSDHLTTIFPEVRLKKYLEMRGADSGPWRAALRAAGLVGRAPLRPGLARRRLGPGQGLDGRGPPGLARCRAAPGAGRPHRTAQRARCGARRAELSRAGLERRSLKGCRGRDESFFLDVLDDIVARGRTRAEDLLDLFHGQWEGDIDRVYRDFAY